MSDYADKLAKANAEIKSTNIKGKEYAEVPQRVLAFWKLFPEGRIITRKTFDDQSRCDFECEVYRDGNDDVPAATGNAFEIKTGMINSTSYIENCETSAVGRALGFLGIGSSSAIASAEEVNNAIALQGAQSQSKDTEPRKAAYKRIGDKKKQAVAKGVKEEGIEAWYKAYFGDKPLNKLNLEDLDAVEDYLDDLLKG